MPRDLDPDRTVPAGPVVVERLDVRGANADALARVGRRRFAVGLRKERGEWRVDSVESRA